MFNNISARDKNALILLITIVIAFLAYLYLYEPLWNEIQINKSQLTPVIKKNELINNYAKNISELESELQENIKKMQELDLKLPNNYNTAELLFLLQKAAILSNVSILKYETNEDQNTSNKFGEAEFITSTVSITGNPQQIDKYINELLNLKRTIDIVNIKVEKDTQKKGYTAQIKITPFYIQNNQGLNYETKNIIP